MEYFLHAALFWSLWLGQVVLSRGFLINRRLTPVSFSATTSSSLFYQDPNDNNDQVYRKGGNAGLQSPEVYPAYLEDDECSSPFFDFATGDELCWGEKPDHPRNVVEHHNQVAQEKAHFDLNVVDQYHKGGNAHYPASVTPRKLMDEEECDENNMFVDFATGDELCWAI